METGSLIQLPSQGNPTLLNAKGNFNFRSNDHRADVQQAQAIPREEA
jgi:hypothetical protein